MVKSVYVIKRKDVELFLSININQDWCWDELLYANVYGNKDEAERELKYYGFINAEVRFLSINYTYELK